MSTYEDIGESRGEKSPNLRLLPLLLSVTAVDPPFPLYNSSPSRGSFPPCNASPATFRGRVSSPLRQKWLNSNGHFNLAANATLNHEFGASFIW